MNNEKSSNDQCRRSETSCGLVGNRSALIRRPSNRNEQIWHENCARCSNQFVLNQPQNNQGLSCNINQRIDNPLNLNPRPVPNYRPEHTKKDWERCSSILPANPPKNIPEIPKIQPTQQDVLRPQVQQNPHAPFIIDKYKPSPRGVSDKSYMRLYQNNLKDFEKRRNRLCSKSPKKTIPNPDDIAKGFDLESTPIKGWKRATQKYDPEFEALLSPVKHHMGVITPQIHDIFIQLNTWTLHMSEMFYYDNIILLLSQRQLKVGDQNHDLIISNTLRRNYDDNVTSMVENWTDIIILGKGTYGSVYRVKDSNTNTYYALKHVLFDKETITVQKSLPSYLSFIEERNSLIRAHKSPFMMQFLHSFVIPEAAGLFLLFEYCLSDLGKFIYFLQKMNSAKIEYDLLWKDKGWGIKRIRSIYKDKFRKRSIEVEFDHFSHVIGTDIKHIFIIYTYEMFCALDFMAKCNIVHRDIKPDNIMLSQNCHLKIGDFGMVINNYFVTSEENGKMISGAMSLSLEVYHYEGGIAGTPMFLEPDVIKEEENQDFMTDAFAVGMSVLYMVFCGELYFWELAKKPNVHNDLIWKPKKDLTIYEYNDFLQVIMENKTHHKKYIAKGLKRFFSDSKLRSLMKVIAELFLPRRNRAKQFSSVKMMQQYKARYKAAYIDIDKVSKLEPFKNLKLTPHNVLTTDIPLDIFLDETGNKRRLTGFEKVCGNDESSIQKQLLQVKPGLGFNFFNE